MNDPCQTCAMTVSAPAYCVGESSTYFSRSLVNDAKRIITFQHDVLVNETLAFMHGMSYVAMS